MLPHLSTFFKIYEILLYLQCSKQCTHVSAETDEKFVIQLSNGIVHD